MPDLILIDNTPIEIYSIRKHSVYVKREDLCCKKPGPPFSKVRGALLHLKKLKSAGINTVGYVETSISMAGWGVAWICSLLDMQTIIFDPQYKNPSRTLQYHRKQWNKHKAILVPIKAGRAKINWYICRKILQEKYPEAVLLPLGIPFQETIIATSEEVKKTMSNINCKINTFVISVGSGTIVAGLWKGLDTLKISSNIYGIMCRSGNLSLKKKSIISKTRILDKGMFPSVSQLHLIDPGWGYTDKSKIKSPFPCNPYYDKKAWEWLVQNITELKKPILFWNIGK